MIDSLMVDNVAKKMCEELGLDPYETVLAPYGAEKIDKDAWDPEPTPRIHDPGVAPKYYVAENWSSASYQIPRWQTFRKDAAKAIAGWRAVQHWILVDSP